MPQVATIILNRNLPDVTDRLYEQLARDGDGLTDIYVTESGSDPDKASRYQSWNADWPEARESGLRYPRGFNYGLSQLYREGRFTNYDYFFLVCNDIEFSDRLLPPLVEEMNNHPRLGILSPCAENWGEYKLFGNSRMLYVWHISHVAWLVRRKFVEQIMCTQEPMHMGFLYDGSNFRGHLCDIELVVKGYVNEWATGLTRRSVFRENLNYLKTRSEVMRTDSYEENRRQVVSEGKEWLRRKYGFNSSWHMQQYAQLVYDGFFRLNPEFERYRI